MSGRSHANGHAGAAMLKAMSRYLERANGRAEAEAWLSSFRMEWNDLEDESRTVPLIRLAQGVKQFVAVAGREAISAAALYLLSPDVLGAWARVLRGSTGPGDALDKLDGNDSELPRTVRWETLRQSRGRWEGRAQISHDPSLEQDGLLRAVRMAEISVLPMLFGLERGVVSSIEKVSDGSYVQEFDVHWKLPSASRVVTTGVLAGGLIGAIPFASAPGALGAAWLAVGAGAGAMVGILTGRDRARRVESASQRTRVQVLERTLLLRDARQSLQSGTLEGTVVAGQFRVVRRMGSGGSGVIYEAVRMSDGLPVAIKLLRAVAAQEAVASDRLRREAEALGLAWHPNVVDVLEHGHLPDGTSYLVMELLRGETLAARLERNRRLLPVELLPIALQVCDALVAVHAAGVVHRDLKPSNIFLSGGGPETDEGEAEEAAEVKVKLIDFGIARVEWEETRITNMGAPIGTPGYMSPEQEAGGVIDARSDVFALGAVLYECLVGETPPPNKAVSWGPPSAPPTGSNPPPQMNSGVRPAVRTVPVAWRAFLSRAMALDPADRFADARTMAQALKDLSLGSLSSLPAAAQAEADDAFNESASSTRGTELGKG